VACLSEAVARQVLSCAGAVRSPVCSETQRKGRESSMGRIQGEYDFSEGPTPKPPYLTWIVLYEDK
jgi:hypothetical protein